LRVAAAEARSHVRAVGAATGRGGKQACRALALVAGHALARQTYMSLFRAARPVLDTRHVTSRPRLAIALLLATASSACSIARFPPPAPPRTSTLGLTIESLTLANGQRVVLVDDPHAVDVQVTVRYQVGAVDDGPHPGMAHFVEHLIDRKSVV